MTPIRHHLWWPLAWTLYFALPVRGWGIADGSPLGPLEAGAIALGWWVWVSDRHVAGRRALIALIVAKVILGTLLLDRGMAARYYANDTWGAPVEQSVEFRRPDITRRDEQIAFGGDGQPDLPLFFFNDLRFNFYTPADPLRDRLPYSVIWDGFLFSDGGPRSATFYLMSAAGTRAELAVDSRAIMTLDGASEREATTSLAPGWHQVSIRLAAPYGSGRRIEAGEIVGNQRRPFDDRVLAGPASTLRRSLDAPVRWIGTILDLVMFAWLGILLIERASAAWRAADVRRLFWAVVIVEAVLFALPYARHVQLLSGGDDWLVYESNARAIALGDPLLWLGADVGSAFYFQPLYQYFVALTHLGFGDSLFGVVFVQRVLLAVTAAVAASMTTSLFGGEAGRVALVAGVLFMYAKGGPWSRILLAEPLFMPLLTVWIWILVRTATAPITATKSLAAGIVGGLATLARSTLLLAWPPVLAAWCASLPARRVRRLIALVAIMFAVIAVATLRNWIVADTFVPIATSGSINLYLGNTPPGELLPAPPWRAGVYEGLNLPDYTRLVLEYALQMPGAFMSNLGSKALYTVGLFSASGIRGGAMGTSWFYVGMWLAALAGLVRVLREPLQHRWTLIALPGLAALSHFAAVVLIFPHVYADRLILPLYPLLIPYAAFGVEPIVSWARHQPARAASYGLVALVASVFLPASPRGTDVIAVLAVLLVVLALAVTPLPRFTPRAWIYVAYCTPILAGYARARWDGDFGPFRLLWGLLLPIAVFGIARLTRHPATYRTALAAFILAAVISLAVLQPPLPELPNELDEIGDVARDLQNVVRGNVDARQDLRDDAVGVWNSLVRLPREAVGMMTEQIGIVGTICLLGIWIQTLATTFRDGVRRRCALSAACFAALLLGAIGVLVGIAPNRWNAGGYSIATLAILFGLAESRLAPAVNRRGESAINTAP